MFSKEILEKAKAIREKKQSKSKRRLNVKYISDAKMRRLDGSGIGGGREYRVKMSAFSAI